MKNEQQIAVADSLSPEPRRRSRWFLPALLAVTALALGLRLYRLDAESLYMDEFWQVGSYSMPMSYVVTRAAAQGYPPLDYTIGVGIHRLGLADSDWWVRFPAAVFGAGGVLLLGIWMRRVGGDFAGIVAAALLTICPLHISMSREARPYTIFIFLAIATMLTFIRARRLHTFAAWCVYSLTLLLMLLTRWDGPHFILGAIALFAFGVWLRTRYLSFSPRAVVEREHAVFRSAFIASLVAVACHNPVLGVILEYNRQAIGAHPGRLWHYASQALHGAFAASVHGYSPRTLKPFDGPNIYLIAAAVMSVIGLLAIVRSLRRSSDDTKWLFIVAAVPFPFLYAGVYAALSSFAPKPQYLLFLAVPLFGTIAAGLDAVRRAIAAHAPRIGLVTALLAGALLAVPMTRASVQAVATARHRDWRGVYTFLRTHAGAGDAFAATGSQGIPAYHEPATPGTERYLRMPVRFKRVDLGLKPVELDTPAWSDHENTLWLLCYTNRLYEDVEQVPPPRDVPAGIRVYPFNGLFLVQVTGAAPARDRLAEALAALYQDLPDHRSLIAPAVFLQRYYAARGEVQKANIWKRRAIAQCRPPDSIELLAQRFAEIEHPTVASAEAMEPRLTRTKTTAIPNERTGN